MKLIKSYYFKNSGLRTFRYYYYYYYYYNNNNNNNSNKINAMVSLTVSTYVQDWTQPQNVASKLFSQIWQKRFIGHCCQKCMGEKANLVRITNSTRIACCSKMTYKCFEIFSAEPLYFRLWLLLIPFSIANNPRMVHGSNSSLLQL